MPKENYSVYYAAHNVKIAQLGSAANRVSNCMESTLQLVRKNIPEEAGRKAAAEEIAGKITEFKAMLISNAINHLSTDFDRRRQNIDDWIVPALSMEILAGDKIRDVLENYETPNKLYKEAEAYADLLISKGLKTASLQKVKDLIWPRISELSDLDRRKKEAEQKKRIDAYWAEHTEERETLLAEQAQLEEQKKELSRKIDELRRKQAEVPAQADVTKKDAEIDELLRRMNSLGLFKGKEKKAIQEQIDAAQEEMKKLRDVLNAQRDEIEKEITPISTELTPVNQRLREIKTELTKDR